METDADAATEEDGTAVAAIEEEDAVADDDAMETDANAATEEDGTAVAVIEEEDAVADDDAVETDADAATGENGTAVAAIEEEDAVVDDDAVEADADAATGEDGTAVAVIEEEDAVADDDAMEADAGAASEEDGTAVAVVEEEDAVSEDDVVLTDTDAAAAEDGATAAVDEDDAIGDVAAVAASDVGVSVGGDDASADAGTQEARDDATGASDDDLVMEEEVAEAADPEFDVVRVEVTGDAVMAGVGEPGATIVVTSGDDVVGETVADDAGDWVIVTEEPLDPGAHELELTSVNGDGETKQSDTVVVVSVPQEPEVDDVLTVMMNDEDGGDIEIIQGGEDGIGISGGGDLALESVTYDEEGNVSMGGQATAGDTVVVYVDDRVAGVADVEDGEWTVALDESVEEGTHSLRVDEVNEEGDVVARLETPFVRATFIMPDASDRLIVIQPGNSLWRIARRSFGRGILYTLIYEANRNQIADPDLIYPGQIFVMPENKVAEH